MKMNPINLSLCFLVLFFTSFKSFGQSEEKGNSIDALYLLPSGFLGGVNLVSNIVNGMQLSKMEGHKGFPILGLLTGAGQLTIGIVNLNKNTTAAPLNGYATVNQKRKSLTVFNVGMGGLTVLLSSINLLANPNQKNQKIQLNVQEFYTVGNSPGFGLSLKTRF